MEEEKTKNINIEDIEEMSSEEILEKMKLMEEDSKNYSDNPKDLLEDAISNIDLSDLIDLGIKDYNNLNIKRFPIELSNYEKNKITLINILKLDTKKIYKNIAQKNFQELDQEEKIIAIINYISSQYNSKIEQIKSRNVLNKERAIKYAKESQNIRKKINLNRTLAYKIQEEITILQKESNEYKKQLRDEASSELEEKRIELDLKIEEKQNKIYELRNNIEAEINKYNNSKELLKRHSQDYKIGLSNLTHNTKYKDSLEYYLNLFKQYNVSKDIELNNELNYDENISKIAKTIEQIISPIVEKNYEEKNNPPQIKIRDEKEKYEFIDTKKEIEKIELMYKEINKR